MSRFYCIVVLSLTLLGMSAASAQAQVRSNSGRPTRFQPARPTLSPYLNLFRSNGGVLPNYYTFVRPDIRQRSTNQRQQGINRQQQLFNLQGSANMGLLQRQINQQPLNNTVQPTGVGSSFRNFGGYYSGLR